MYPLERGSLLGPKIHGREAYKINFHNVKPGFPSIYVPNDHGKIALVPSDFFSDTERPNKDYENTAVMGILINISTPSNNGRTFAGMQYNDRSHQNLLPRSNKVARITHVGNEHQRILVFGDCFPKRSTCFAVICQSKAALQDLLGRNRHVEDFRLGDIVVLLEPQPSRDNLGHNMALIKKPRVMIPFISNLSISHRPIKQSEEPSSQVFFCAHGKSIELSSVTCLVGGSEVPCVNYTCDRQLAKCKGCLGMGLSRKAFVVSCHVSIMDCPQYNSRTGIASFQSFRSMRFTELILEDPVTFGDLSPLDMVAVQYELRDVAEGLVNYVNTHGGWTVVGWHRQGVITGGQDGSDFQVNMATAGHLVLLKPTDATIQTTQAFALLRFKTPL